MPTAVWSLDKIHQGIKRGGFSLTRRTPAPTCDHVHDVGGHAVVAIHKRLTLLAVVYTADDVCAAVTSRDAHCENSVSYNGKGLLTPNYMHGCRTSPSTRFVPSDRIPGGRAASVARW